MTESEIKLRELEVLVFLEKITYGTVGYSRIIFSHYDVDYDFGKRIELLTDMHIQCKMITEGDEDTGYYQLVSYLNGDSKEKIQAAVNMLSK